MAREETSSETFVAVYSADTAQQVNRLKDDQLKHWVRRVDWSARGELAIVGEQNHVWIWEPFSDKIVSTFGLKVEDRLIERFAAVSDVQWADEGELLIARAGDGTIEIWDRMANTKWRLQRPEGSGPERSVGVVRWVKEDRTLRTFSRDGFMSSYRI